MESLGVGFRSAECRPDKAVQKTAWGWLRARPGSGVRQPTPATPASQGRIIHQGGPISRASGPGSRP